MPPQDTNPTQPTNPNNPPLPSTGPVTPIVPQMPPAKSNKNLITLIVVVILIIILGAVAAFATRHGASGQNSQQASTAAAAMPNDSMAGTLAPSASNAGLTTYTGTGDTFFSFSYPKSFALNQFPSGVSLVATATDPIAAGLTADDNHEFDIYIGGDTEKQVDTSVLGGAPTKVADAPTEGYTTYDLVLPYVVYHVVEFYLDQGHDLDLVTLGSYNTASSTPVAWMNAYKAVIASETIDKTVLAKFIADAKARGVAAAAAQAAASTTASTSVQAQ